MMYLFVFYFETGKQLSLIYEIGNDGVAVIKEMAATPCYIIAQKYVYVKNRYTYFFPFDRCVIAYTTRQDFLNNVWNIIDWDLTILEYICCNHILRIKTSDYLNMINFMHDNGI